MINTLTIAICDTDSYFSEGIKQALREYFSHKDNVLVFTQAYSKEKSADLVFTSILPTRRARYCSGEANRTLFISIRNKPNAWHTHRPACVLEAGTLFRHDSHTAIFIILDRALSSGSTFFRRQSCQLCTGSQLTIREQEVLGYLRRGISQSKTSEQMQLSVKTINAHKKSVMRKMDLTRKHDFIHWLLHSG